jgi:hypothetical protein
MMYTYIHIYQYTRASSHFLFLSCLLNIGHTLRAAFSMYDKESCCDAAEVDADARLASAFFFAAIAAAHDILFFAHWFSHTGFFSVRKVVR